MAFTNQDIINAYNQTVGAGTMSEADFVSQAQSQYGVSADQLGSARNELMGTTAPAPAPSNVVSSVTAAPAPAADRFTDTQYSAARDWANGKDWGTIAAKGSELGLTAAEMGKVFGNFGGSGSQVTSLTGYGNGISGFNPDGSFKYQTGFAGGKLADGSNPGDWSFDSTKGWIQAAKPKAPVNQWNSSAPSTGINLSQLQNANMWQVQPNQTVQSQLQGIIASDSPLMQQARARALQAANQRGLLNSTMSVTAGEDALYNAAMPIAQQDASTYADAAKFNTGELNTFGRDSNAFTRDAFMADFNLAANEWAKQQDQQRTYDQLDYTQKLTLDRDAVQNGYTSARDALLNGYTVQRDAATNQYTLQRDDVQNKFTASQAELDRIAAMQRTAAGQQADTSVERTAMQIAADKDKYTASRVENAKTDLLNQRVAWASKIVDINGSSMNEDQKTEAVKTLASAYTPVINSLATTAGLNPADYMPVQITTATGAPTTTPTNVVQNVTQGGDGG